MKRRKQQKQFKSKINIYNMYFIHTHKKNQFNYFIKMPLNLLCHMDEKQLRE